MQERDERAAPVEINGFEFGGGNHSCCGEKTTVRERSSDGMKKEELSLSPFFFL